MIRVLVFGMALAALALGVHVGESRHAHAAGPLALQQVATGLSNPLGIASAGDSRLFIVERGGRIKIYNGSGILPTPFLDVSGLVTTSGFEQGLLGLAFHPDYPATPYFFVIYTPPSGNVVLARYSVSGDPNIANSGSGVILRSIAHPGASNHNGGQLAFGPDGYLYAAIGDGGMGQSANAQLLTNYLGKILRLDVDQNVNTPPYYAIPPSNPFAGATPGLDEIWSYGLRNPWRFSFDRADGDLLIADVGEGSIEEIDYQPNGDPGGRNYGWDVMEGSSCAGGGPPGCGHASLVKPILEYDHSGGNCSVTGGYVYRGAVTAYHGTYTYGDFCSGIIWAATPNSPQWNSTQVLDTGYFISSFGEDQNGELYLADYFGGTIQRLVFTGNDTDSDGVANSSDNCPTTVNPAQNDNDDGDGPFGGWQAWVVDGTGAEGAALGGDDCDANDDNNGCSDAREPAMAPARNPANPWDFADMWVPALPAAAPVSGNETEPSRS